MHLAYHYSTTTAPLVYVFSLPSLHLLYPWKKGIENSDQPIPHFVYAIIIEALIPQPGFALGICASSYIATSGARY